MKAAAFSVGAMVAQVRVSCGVRFFTSFISSIKKQDSWGLEAQSLLNDRCWWAVFIERQLLCQVLHAVAADMYTQYAATCVRGVRKRAADRIVSRRGMWRFSYVCICNQRACLHLGRWFPRSGTFPEREYDHSSSDTCFLSWGTDRRTGRCSPWSWMGHSGATTSRECLVATHTLLL